MLDELGHKDVVVQSLGSAMLHGGGSLRAVPDLVVKVVDGEMWQKRRIKKLGNKVVTFDRFEDFVATPPLEGLGEDMATLKRLCRDEPRALKAIDSVTGHEPGKRTDLVDNINKVEPEERPTGTSRQYALRKLEKDAPEMLQKVLAGELSCHRAMINAGFRKELTPLEAAQKAYEKLDDESRRAFHEWLGKDR